jgi:MscS family membrane protein
MLNKPTRLRAMLYALLITFPMTLNAADNAPTLKDVVEKQDTEKVVGQDETMPVKGPYDEYNRSTPRSSVMGLAKALAAYEFDTAVNYLDLRNLPFTISEEDGPELARKLLIIAQRSMMVDYESISDDPGGHPDDGLPSYRDRVTTINTSEGPIDILMQRVPRGDGVYIWKLSNATVTRIPELNKEFGYGAIGDKLSLIFPHYAVLGLELWQWAMLVILIVIGYLFAYVTGWLLFKLVQLFRKNRVETAQKFINGPLRFLILVLFVRATFDLIAPSLVARAIFEAGTLLIVAVVWFLIGILDLVLSRISERMKKLGQAEATVLLRPARTVLRTILLLTGLITWLDNLGYEVTTLIAGLGVGGVAVAFAAQRTLENVIGSITIYSSQPVHVGDLCKFGDKLGVVEEIGLRATQLRTLERTVVHIPNARFSTDIIENLTQRDKILYRTRLRLSLQTTSSQMREVLEGIRKLIEQHEMIDEDTSRVRFLEFGEYAQEIELYVYIMTNDFVEYLQHREDINLRIKDIIEASGTELVVPANTTYFEGSPIPATGVSQLT